MKAERRHELRENDLLHALESTRDYLSQNGSRIALTVVVVLVIVGAISFGLRARTQAYEDIWRRKADLTFEDVTTGRQSLQSLAALTRETSDSAFVLQGLIDLGRNALRLSEKVLTPPDPELTKQARDAFEQLRQRFPDNPMALGVALMGLATVEENEYAIDKDAAHKDRAKKYLDEVIASPQLAGLPFQRMARDRLDRLDETFSPVVVGPPAAPPMSLEELMKQPAPGGEGAPGGTP